MNVGTVKLSLKDISQESNIVRKVRISWPSLLSCKVTQTLRIKNVPHILVFDIEDRQEHRNIDDDHYQWRRYIIKYHKSQPVRTTSSSPNDTRAPQPEKFGGMEKWRWFDAIRFVTLVAHYLCTFSLNRFDWRPILDRSAWTVMEDESIWMQLMDWGAKEKR